MLLGVLLIHSQCGTSDVPSKLHRKCLDLKIRGRRQQAKGRLGALIVQVQKEKGKFVVAGLRRSREKNGKKGMVHVQRCCFAY